MGVLLHLFFPVYRKHFPCVSISHPFVPPLFSLLSLWTQVPLERNLSCPTFLYERESWERQREIELRERGRKRDAGQREKQKVESESWEWEKLPSSQFRELESCEGERPALPCSGGFHAVSMTYMSPAEALRARWDTLLGPDELTACSNTFHPVKTPSWTQSRAVHIPSSKVMQWWINWSSLTLSISAKHTLLYIDGYCIIFSDYNCGPCRNFGNISMDSFPQRLSENHQSS